MKSLSQLFEARGTDSTSNSFRRARRKLIAIYLLIIAVVVLLFSVLVVLQVNQRELANQFSPHTEITLNTSEAQLAASLDKPNAKITNTEYELRGGVLIYEVYFDDGESVFVDVATGNILPDMEKIEVSSLFNKLTDETYEIVGWLGLIVFLIASVGSIVVANNTLKPISESVQKQKRFVSDAAHELRNPLAALQVTLESYIRSDEKTLILNESVAKDLLSEVKRLIATSESLLSFEKAEVIKKSLTPCSVKVSLVGVVQRLESLLKEKNIIIEEDISETIIGINAQDIDTILYNLLHNAIKFSHANSKIVVTWNGSEMAVSDTGVGIETENIPHIFERFYKVDKARSFATNSSGLGLALVAEIVRSYGGTIDVQSVIGKGTKFIVRPSKNLRNLESKLKLTKH